MGDGTVFEVAAGSGTITTLASFNDSNGAEPQAQPGRGQQRQSLRHHQFGGATGDGTVFEVAGTGAAITTLASFNGTNGATPSGSLVEDSSGNLFGTTDERRRVGRTARCSRWQRGSDTITTLASFNGTQRGSTPAAAWSRTAAAISSAPPACGGASGDGTVFEVAQGSGTITTLASFNGTQREPSPTPAWSRTAAAISSAPPNDGGASGDGTVFEVAQGSGTITTLASFNGTNGADPTAAWSRTAAAISSAPRNQAARMDDGTVFEVGARQRHHHHPRPPSTARQRGEPLRRPGRGHQRQSLRHHGVRRHV